MGCSGCGIEPFTKMHGADVTRAWLDSTSQEEDTPSPSLFYGPNREPFVVPASMGGLESLGGKIPENIGYQDVARLIGRSTKVDVIDVATQQSSQWTLGKWADYISDHHDRAWEAQYAETSQQGRQAYTQKSKIYNVISLEISGTPLGRKVRPPSMVTDIDWVDRYWPDVPGRKKGRRTALGGQNKSADRIEEKVDDAVGGQVEVDEVAAAIEQGKAEWPKVQSYCLMGMKGSWTVSFSPFRQIRI